MTTVASATGNKVQVIVSENGQSGPPGVNGTDGSGFNNVRKSKLDNPIMSVLSKNNLVDAISGSLSWVRGSSASYINIYGVVSYAAINEPRSESGGFLIENTSTNYLLYSEQIDNVAWLKIGGASVTPNNKTSPDGSLTADTLSLPTAGSSAISQSTAEQSQNKEFSVSVYLKGVAGETVKLDLSNLVDDSASLNITLTDSWVRYELSHTFNSTTAFASAFLTRNVGQTASSVDVWGFQLEDSEAASSLITTTSAPATRAADIVTTQKDGNFPPVSGSEFSILMSIKSYNTSGPGILIDWRGSSFERVFVSSGNLFLGLSTGDVALTSGQPITENAEHSISISFDGVSATTHIDGVKGLTVNYTIPKLDTSGLINIGGFSGVESILGSLENVKLYDFALNDSESELLTKV